MIMLNDYIILNNFHDFDYIMIILFDFDLNDDYIERFFLFRHTSYKDRKTLGLEI